MQAIPHVAHGDILPQRRGRTSRRHLTHALALVVHDLGALARGRSLDHEADTTTRGRRPAFARGYQLWEDDVGAVEAAFLAARLCDDPGEAAFDGGGAVVQVVAVEAHARFETQAVARAQAGQPQFVAPRGLQEVRGHGDRVLGRDGDLEAVFAGVTAAGGEDDGRLAVGEGELDEFRGAEVEVLEVDGGGVGEYGLQDIGGQGTLQCNQALAGELFELDRGLVGVVPRVNVGHQVGVVLFATPGVGHDVELLGREARDDGVVADAAGLGMQERGEGGLVWRKGGEVGWSKLLEQGGGAGAAEVVLHPTDRCRLVKGGRWRMINGDVLTCGSRRTSSPSHVSICAIRPRRGRCTVQA